MTLLENRLPLFPLTTRLEAESGRLSIAGWDLAGLAEEHGTPLYVYDLATMDAAVQAYRQSLAESYPGESGLTYAGKAFLCRAVAGWALQRGLLLDCTGAGEIHIARAAGAPPESILVHGVNKSSADLAAAWEHAGVIVADHPEELQRIAALARASSHPGPQVWLRLRPGLAVDTHAHRQTGQATSKFGFSAEELVEAAVFCLDHGLDLAGLHFHQGSHFHDPAPLEPALELALDVVDILRGETGWLPRILSPGGGWGVAYHEDELPQPSPARYAAFVAGRLAEGCHRRGLPLPRLQLEPGRSLVAQAGVAVYRVGAVKWSGGKRWLLIDGGLSDNPRPALYAARYSALPVQDPGRPVSGPASLGGPYCESGDVLIHDLPLPEVQPGELIAVPASGAYQISMSSNYNGALRPAVVFLQDAQACLVQRRETLNDLLRRDQPWIFA